jgi:hypothetical protein
MWTSCMPVYTSFLDVDSTEQSRDISVLANLHSVSHTHYHLRIIQCRQR